MNEYEAKAVTTVLVSDLKGRGKSFVQNVNFIKNNGKEAIEIIGRPVECKLGFMMDKTDLTIFPALVFPDGRVELAIMFEIQDEQGQWKEIDIQNLAKKLKKELEETECKRYVIQ